MIEYRRLDITTVKSGIIAHGVNCQKKMGSGVAAAIKKKWPVVYSAFMSAEPQLGAVDLIDIGKDLWVANCYTQDRYGYDGKVYADIQAIEDCLLSLAGIGYDKHVPVYLPKIGCGLGGLNWDTDVKRILEYIDLAYLPYDDVQFIVCEL